MKRIILSALCALPMMAFGQVLLYNDGAMLKVQAGATLFVEGGIQNTASGTIDNDGIIELQGNFINAGMWEPSQPNTLKFSGNNDADITSGSAVFQTVQMAKGSGGDLTLLSPMTVNTNLDFNGVNNKIILGSNHLKLGGATTVTGYDDDEYVVTAGTGRVKKFYSGTGAFEFPVGFNATTYNRAEVNITAGPADTISVRVLGSPTDGNGLTGTAITSDVVDAVWDISESTVGGNTANVKLGWAETDELTGFDDLLNTVSRNDGTNGWDGLFADLGPEVSNTRTKDGYTAFGAFAVGDKPISNSLLVNAKVFLQGPYMTANGLMVDSIRHLGDFPLVEPYSSLPSNPYDHQAYGGGESVSASVLNQPADDDDIVDWIILELRDGTTPTIILATKSCLVQRDGDIVDLDGISDVAIQGMSDGGYKLGIRHRNHLGIRSDASYTLGNTAGSLIDFSVLGTTFDDNTITKPTTPVRLLSGSIYGMWAGDASFNGDVSFNGSGNDKNIVLVAVGGASNANNVVPGYNRADLNLNGVTSFNGSANDKNVILQNVTSADVNNPLSAHNNN